jgi:carbonic anhydrase
MVSILFHIQPSQTTVAELLRTSPSVIRDAVKESNLKVPAGVYDLATGKLALS